MLSPEHYSLLCPSYVSYSLRTCAYTTVSMRKKAQKTLKAIGCLYYNEQL